MLAGAASPGRKAKKLVSNTQKKPPSMTSSLKMKLTTVKMSVRIYIKIESCGRAIPSQKGPLKISTFRNLNIAS